MAARSELGADLGLLFGRKIAQSFVDGFAMRREHEIAGRDDLVGTEFVMKRRGHGPANRREFVRRACIANIDYLGFGDETNNVAMALPVVEQNVITGLKTAELALKRRAQSRARQTAFLIAPVEDRHLVVFRSHRQTAVSFEDDDVFVVAQWAIADAQTGLARECLR